MPETLFYPVYFPVCHLWFFLIFLTAVVFALTYNFAANRHVCASIVPAAKLMT